MKLTALMVGAALSGFTVIPKEADLNLHYLDGTYAPSAACPGGQIQVKGVRFVEGGLNQEGLPGYNERAKEKGDGVSSKSNYFCMAQSELQKEREWAKSVYATQVATGTKNEGTSFLVGDNIILTNHHIAVPVAKDPTNCRALKVLTRTDSPKWVDCKKILYCNASRDFCFVEMNEVSPGVNLGDLSRPLKFRPETITTQKAYLIGNSAARGIQGSKGRVFADADTPKHGRLPLGEFIHTIPMVGGASGSPILNLNGEVLGINHSHSKYAGVLKDLIDNSGNSHNQATSTLFIYQDLANFLFAQAGPTVDFLTISRLRQLFR